MPFLGNSPTEVYKTVAKQTIVGNGALVYALDYAVTTANELEVFVNNVRQEPGTTYAASGALITFTDALLSTDSCYVIFQGRAVTSNVIQSQNLQDGAVTPAKLDRSYVNKTGDTMSGVHRHNSYLAIGKGGSNNDQITWNAIPDNSGGYTPHWASSGDAGGVIMGLPYGGGGGLEIRTLRHGTDGSMKSLSAYPVRMYIDDYGRVTMPGQPRFRAGNAGVGTCANDAPVIFASNIYNPTNSYDSSNGRFTAPTAGFYHFDSVVRCDQSLNFGAYSRIRLFVNGSHKEWHVGDAIYGTSNNSQSYTSWQLSVNIELAAGDYVTINYGSANGNTITLSNCGFSGYLIG